jgi:hypothetical protein
MFPTHLIRLTQAAMLAAVVAVFVPNLAQGKPIAKAVLSSPSTVVLDGRSPDTRDAAYNTQFQVIDGRSPDTLDAAQNAQTAQLQVLDGRSPDTLDAAQTVQPIELTTSSGFDWSDAGIGAASGAGLLLLLGVSMLLLLRTHRRHDVQAT